MLAKADAQGNIVATYNYAPYGAQVLGTPPSGPAGYTGHVNNAESGFVYIQQRYYDPLMGRFLSADPISPVAANLYNFNRYDYSNNNPLNNIDPDGKWPIPLLFQLHWLHQVVDDTFQHDVKEPAKYLAQNTSEKLEKVDLKLEVSAARGIGVKGSASLLHGSFDVSFIPAGYDRTLV